MLQTRELFDSMAVKSTLSSDDLAATIDALQDCIEATTACSAAMLTEDDRAKLAHAVSHDLDCADVATATRNVLSRGSGPDNSLISAQLEACVLACERSHYHCREHAAAHCRICSDATQRCADQCRHALAALHH
jgi:hypothetical protein